MSYKRFLFIIIILKRTVANVRSGITASVSVLFFPAGRGKPNGPDPVFHSYGLFYVHIMLKYCALLSHSLTTLSKSKSEI